MCFNIESQDYCFSPYVICNLKSVHCYGHLDKSLTNVYEVLYFYMSLLPNIPRLLIMRYSMI